MAVRTSGYIALYCHFLNVIAFPLSLYWYKPGSRFAEAYHAYQRIENKTNAQAQIHWENMVGHSLLTIGSFSFVTTVVSLLIFSAAIPTTIGAVLAISVGLTAELTIAAVGAASKKAAHKWQNEQAKRGPTAKPLLGAGAETPNSTPSSTSSYRSTATQPRSHRRQVGPQGGVQSVGCNPAHQPHL